MWQILLADEFEPEFFALPQQVQDMLVAGDKSGGSEKRFYRELVRKADQRFDAHLSRIRKAGK